MLQIYTKKEEKAFIKENGLGLHWQEIYAIIHIFIGIIFIYLDYKVSLISLATILVILFHFKDERARRYEMMDKFYRESFYWHLRKCKISETDLLILAQEKQTNIKDSRALKAITALGTALIGTLVSLTVPQLAATIVTTYIVFHCEWLTDSIVESLKVYQDAALIERLCKEEIYVECK